jgi:hypothetical protein
MMRLIYSLCFVAVLVACGGGGGSSVTTTNTTPPDTTTPDTTTPDTTGPTLTAYRANTIYANRLPACVLAETRADACALSQLPLIGSEGPVTREAVMQRLVVSHDWMGGRFEELLQRLPDDVVQLFGAVSGVVVSYDIRPSFYWRLTNAIYLDPADLWLTNEEKATIFTEPDYRSGFGSALLFLSTWDYMLNDNFAWDYYPLDGTEERTIDDIVLPNAQLILHELAHANDVFPPIYWNSLDTAKKPDLAAYDLVNYWASEKLSSQYPLTSQLMVEVGDVLFDGVDASESILALTAYDLGVAMAPDGANDDYNYHTSREDVAMMFEEAMMSYLFGTDRIVAFLDRPTVDSPTCNDYLTGWGERGRVAASQIQPRLRLVLEHILPSLNADQVIGSLPPVLSFEQGVGYCNNIIQTSNQRNLRANSVPRADGQVTAPNLYLRFHPDRLSFE